MKRCSLCYMPGSVCSYCSDNNNCQSRCTDLLTLALLSLLKTNSNIFPPFVQTFRAGVNTTQSKTFTICSTKNQTIHLHSLAEFLLHVYTLPIVGFKNHESQQQKRLYNKLQRSLQYFSFTSMSLSILMSLCSLLFLSALCFQ